MTSGASNTLSEDLTGATGPGLGDHLQKARIQQGLSTEDVASQLHLKVGILEAIEKNNFEHIGAPIFVKGYLRAYARALSLEEDEIIRQYQNFSSEADPPIGTRRNFAAKISSGDARIKWFTYLIVIGLLGLLAFWWWDQYQAETDLVSLDAEQFDSVLQPQAMLEPVADEAADPDPVASNPAVSNSAPDDAIASETVASETVANPAVRTDTVEESDVALSVEDSPEVTDPEVALEKQAVLSPEAETTLPEASAEDAVSKGSDQLRIVVSGDTWVEIKDADGQRLLFQLLYAGQAYNLVGKAPFSVLLGNGNGVELTYNNEMIDITGRIRSDNTARLNIGG